MIKYQCSWQQPPCNWQWPRNSQNTSIWQVHFSWEKIHPTSLFEWTWQKTLWWGGKSTPQTTLRHTLWSSTEKLQIGGTVNTEGHMSFSQNDVDKEEQGGRPSKNQSILQCYHCRKFEQHYANKCPHTKEKATYMKKKAIKSGTLTIKDVFDHMHIADDDDAII